MRTLVVVPMKDPAVSKTRLASTMAAEDRKRISLTLFWGALDFFRNQYPEFERLVVTASPRIAAIAGGNSARVLLEEGIYGLNLAASSAFRWAVTAGFQRLLLVPGDIPVWLRGEVDELLNEGQVSTVVVARAHDGGTNALLIDLVRANQFVFQFGPDSSDQHAESARALALTAVLRSWPFLSRDIDTAEDCRVFGGKLLAQTGVD